MPMPEAILLDLDNTILAYDAVAEECWQEVCASFAPRIEGLDAGRLYAAIKEGRDYYWGDAERHRRGRLNLNMARAEAVSIGLSRLGIGDPGLSREMAGAYAVKRDAATIPFPGAIDTLRYFRRRCIRLALVTNGGAEMQRQKIDRFGLAPFFNCILIEGEFGRGKPEEQVFLHVLEQLQVAPKDTWMVGDDLMRDIAPARGLGITAIWVDWRGEGLPETATVRPDRVIGALSGLIDETRGNL